MSTAQHDLAPHLPLDATDRFVDVVLEGYDIAVRSHFSPLPDSGWVQRQVRVDPIILVAAPDYLALRGTPATPADLQQHDGLLVAAGADQWQLANGQGDTVRIAPRPRMTANESVALLHGAQAGLGIVCAPAHMCREALEAGRLRRVLPLWTAGSVATTLVLPHRCGLLPGVRATVDFLVTCLGGG